MINEKILVPAIFASFIVLEAVTGRFLQKERGSRRDVIIEVLSSLTIVLVTVPLIFAVAPMLVEAIRPGSKDALAFLPWYLMVAILLVGDDMTQYWWHRASHTFPVLYNLHRAHHSGAYLSIRTAYRNNLFYYLFMPGLWIAAVLVHLGFYPVYAVYLVVKMTVIFGAHSSWRWDAVLYRILRHRRHGAGQRRARAALAAGAQIAARRRLTLTIGPDEAGSGQRTNKRVCRRKPAMRSRLSKFVQFSSIRRRYERTFENSRPVFFQPARDVRPGSTRRSDPRAIARRADRA